METALTHDRESLCMLGLILNTLAPLHAQGGGFAAGDMLLLSPTIQGIILKDLIELNEKVVDRCRDASVVIARIVLKMS